MIKIEQPGLQTTVQDLGRPGHYHLGIPMSGAMDRLSLRAANLLVGNDEGAAALEAAFLGPQIRFEADTVVAVTGADMPVKIDGAAAPAWQALALRAGQTLSFDYLRAGARVYIAFAGGIDVPLVLGSRSTYLVGVLGGYQGRPLAVGDVLALGTAAAAPATLAVPDALRRLPGNPARLRVLPGLYADRVTPVSAQQFYADTWQVAPEADRMGYRFRGGRPIEFVPREQPFGAGADPSNIVDSAYPYGSIQIPGGLEPIVLHRDAVSAGGYFQVGAVISADMDLVGQMPPNLAARFEVVDMDTALAARRARREQLEAIRKVLGRD